MVKEDTGTMPISSAHICAPSSWRSRSVWGALRDMGYLGGLIGDTAGGLVATVGDINTSTLP